MSIPRYALPCQYEKRNFDLSFETQGSLLSVKLKRRILKQQVRSIRDDFEKSLKAQMAARRILVKAGENHDDPMWSVIKHIAENPDPHLLSLLTTGEVSRMNRKISRRGRITVFSKKSRTRLLRVGAKLSGDVFGLFLTFTYRANMQDVKVAKSHLEKVCLWITRKYGKRGMLWRMEFQQRGAIHFHVLVLNRAFIPAKELTAYWQKMTGDDSQPDIKKLRSRRGVVAYMSKYIAKVTQDGTNVANEVSGWIGQRVPDYNGEYCTVLSIDEAFSLKNNDEQHPFDSTNSDIGFSVLPYPDNYVGRYWGVINRGAMPFAPIRTIDVRDDGGKAYFQIKRYARRYWKRLSKRIQNFYLFVNNIQRWESLFMSVLVA